MSHNLHEMSLEERKLETQRVAESLYQQNPDWVTFFREVLGIGGVVRRLFPHREDFVEFERSREYVQIRRMLARLRQRGHSTPESQEPTRVITVRMPESLHAALQAEAHTHRTSMNRLCISRLLQVIDVQLAGDEESEAGAEPSGA